MRQKLFLTILITLSFSFIVPAHAADENLSKLKTMFENFLDQNEKAAESGSSKLVREGKILVEPAGKYYAVTFPRLTIEHEDGSSTAIGMISMNAMPGDTPEQWKLTLAIPTPIVHYNSNNQPAMTIDIKSQRFAGIWHEKFENFIKLNAQYQDISAYHHTEKTRIMMPNSKVVYDLKQDENGMWSGPARFDFSNFQMDFEKDGSKARIGKITMESALKEYSIDAAVAYQEQLNALNESYQSGDDASVSTAHIMGLYNLIFNFMGNTWDGFDFSAGIQDFQLTKPPIPGSPAGSMNIGNAALGFDMNGFRSGAVSMGLKLAYNGFDMKPVPKEFNEATPDHINLDIRINNLPYKEIVELGKTSLQGTMNAPQAANMVGLQAIMALPQLLTQAQTNMTMNNTKIGNTHYNVDADAMVTANLNAVMGATGKASVEILGLDNLIENLNKAVANPEIDQSQKENIQKSLQMLAVVKMMGQMAQNASGQDIRTYEFILNEQGQALLNGTDMQMIMQSAKQGK